MRPLAAFVIAACCLAGCAAAPESPVDPTPSPLAVYRYAWDGSDVAVAGVEHGWLLRISNPSTAVLHVSMLLQGVEEGLFGPVGGTSGEAPRPVWLPGRISGGEAITSPTLRLGAGEATAVLVRVHEYEGDSEVIRTGIRLFATAAASPEVVFAEGVLAWNVTTVPAAQEVSAGDHVRTATVGVWANGTAFYTNIASLLADPGFPFHGDREGATEPLAVYVYEVERGEQPAGSLDSCRGTTILGYNALLKTQAEGSTGVAFLPPERAYTWDGNEEHRLFGDALVFLNTVVAHDGTTGPLDGLPDPRGPCWPASIERAVGEIMPTLPARSSSDSAAADA